MEEFRIVRTYRGDVPSEIMASGLTLEEAQEWCRDPETSSSTATSAEAVARTAQLGDWFDGYEEKER
jgi:hypothetical protein